MPSKIKTPAINALTRGGVPTNWKSHLEGVLIPERTIQLRIRKLAAQIERDYRGKDLVIVALLNGTVMFLVDLIRQLSLPLRLDFMGVSSYGSGTSSRRLVYTKELRLDVRGRHVLLVDDILDTGNTLLSVIGKLAKLGPKTMKLCVLLDKKARRVQPVRADYIGFDIPDLFVVGYGMDFAERYRNLPFIGVLKPERYRASAK